MISAVNVPNTTLHVSYIY